jgi:hypothetical protein
MRHLLKRKGQPASSWPARAVHQCHSPPVPGQLFDIATHACHQGCAGERTEVMCGVSSRSRAPQSGCSQQQQTAMAPLPGQQTTQQATVFCALVRCCNPADFDEGGGWGWGVGWGWVCGGGGGWDGPTCQTWARPPASPRRQPAVKWAISWLRSSPAASVGKDHQL